MDRARGTDQKHTVALFGFFQAYGHHTGRYGFPEHHRINLHRSATLRTPRGNRHHRISVFVNTQPAFETPELGAVAVNLSDVDAARLEVQIVHILGYEVPQPARSNSTSAWWPGLGRALSTACFISYVGFPG